MLSVHWTSMQSSPGRSTTFFRGFILVGSRPLRHRRRLYKLLKPVVKDAVGGKP